MADDTVVQDIREYTHIWKIKNFNYYLKLSDNTKKTLHFTTLFSGLPLNSDGQKVKLEFFFEPRPNLKYWFSYRLIDNPFKDFNFVQLHFYILKSNKEKYGEKILTIRRESTDFCIQEFCDSLTFLEKAGDILPNNTLTLGCDVICHFEVFSFKYERSFTKCQLDGQLIDSLKDVSDEPDSRIIINNEKYEVYTTILEARSNVFKKMFQRETEEGKPTEVTIIDVCPEIFDLMLKFIYTNDFNVEMSKDDTLDLWIAAKKYELTNLQEMCEELLFKMVNVDNAMDMYSLTQRYEMGKLEPIIKEYIRLCKAEIRKTINPDYFFKHPKHMNLLID